jgi:uncharacterized protein
MMNADLLVLGSAWLSGVMGSAHCAAMCGGIAVSFSSDRATTNLLDALEPNLGRILGYGIAGLAAGGLGHGIVTLAQSQTLALALRSAVGLVLIIAALRLLDRQGRLRPTDTGARLVLAGVAWGFLPCGLSSTVLLAAWLQGSAIQGAMTMLAFGLGTWPAMVPLTWSGARLGQGLLKNRLRMPAAALVLVAGLATLAGPWLANVPAVHSLLVALGCRSLE